MGEYNIDLFFDNDNEEVILIESIKTNDITLAFDIYNLLKERAPRYVETLGKDITLKLDQEDTYNIFEIKKEIIKCRWVKKWKKIDTFVVTF